MNIDELKNGWQSLNAMSKEPNDAMVKDIVNGKTKSAREHLMKQYKNTISILVPLGGISQLALIRIIPLYIIIIVMIYLAIAAMMDYYLYKGIKSMDLSSESVTTIAAKAKFYRRRHHLFQLILIPLAVIVIIHYFSCATGWQQIGIVVGIIVGLIAGLPTYLGIMRDYKQLSQ